MGKVFRAIEISGDPWYGPRAKTYYSKMLLDKLIPAIQHIENEENKHHVAPVLDEIELAANEWRKYFGVTLQPVWYETKII